VKIGPSTRSAGRRCSAARRTRDRSKDQGATGCVRLTVGTREQMREAVAAMADALKEIGWEKA